MRVFHPLLFLYLSKDGGCKASARPRAHTLLPGRATGWKKCRRSASASAQPAAARLCWSRWGYRTRTAPAMLRRRPTGRAAASPPAAAPVRKSTGHPARGGRCWKAAETLPAAPAGRGSSPPVHDIFRPAPSPAGSAQAKSGSCCPSLFWCGQTPRPPAGKAGRSWSGKCPPPAGSGQGRCCLPP